MICSGSRKETRLSANFMMFFNDMEARRAAAEAGAPESADLSENRRRDGGPALPVSRLGLDMTQDAYRDMLRARPAAAVVCKPAIGARKWPGLTGRSGDGGEAGSHRGPRSLLKTGRSPRPQRRWPMRVKNRTSRSREILFSLAPRGAELPNQGQMASKACYGPGRRWMRERPVIAEICDYIGRNSGWHPYTERS